MRSRKPFLHRFESSLQLRTSPEHTDTDTQQHLPTHKRAVPGIEPGTSRTLSENHATRPNSLQPSLQLIRSLNSIPCPAPPMQTNQRGRHKQQNLPTEDSVSEWLRRWTRNPLGSARRGSNPLAVDCSAFCLLVTRLRIPKSEDPDSAWPPSYIATCNALDVTES